MCQRESVRWKESQQRRCVGKRNKREERDRERGRETKRDREGERQ